MEKHLKFREDGTFTILQFTDVHWVDGCQEDIRTRNLMKMVVDNERPDLIVFTGDMVYGENNADELRKVLQIVNDTKIPWASVFGNHDSELGSDKKTLLRAMKESPTCLTEEGDRNISGIGNYYLTVNSSDGSKNLWTLYFFDSGAYSSNNNVGGYDFIKRDQIEWYTDCSRKIGDNNEQKPALAFFHIPFPEFNDVWEHSICYGEKNEDVCCPKQNSGLFSAMLEMGDVKGVFVGHDHINDYYGDLYGISLCYGRATGYNTYVREGFAHGARIIRLSENKTSFETWVRLDDGSVIRNPKIHMPDPMK